MKALVLTAPNLLEIQEKPIPENLKKGQVLVKMAYAPINPSDLAFLTGGYGIKKPFPVVPGIEGSGEVVASGGGLYANYLNGKRVACVAGAGDGTWAEYMITEATKCVVLANEVSLEQGAMAFVNPLTAIEMVELAKKGGYQGIVFSAAASALGKMVHYQAAKAGLPFAAVVRRETQVKSLKEKGVNAIFNTSSENWTEELKAWAKSKGKLLFPDAISGGAVPYQILGCLPDKSKMLIYGRLETKKMPELIPQDFIFHGYEIAGYWLNKTVGEKTFLQAMMATRKVQAMLKEGFETKIQATLRLNEFEEAIKQYSSNMSEGKILFNLGS